MNKVACSQNPVPAAGQHSTGKALCSKLMAPSKRSADISSAPARTRLATHCLECCAVLVSGVQVAGQDMAGIE